MHIAGKLYAGNALSAVTDAVQDSRHVKAGNVFFALQPQYITDAVSKGAAAIVSEEEIAESDRAPGVAYYICDDVRLAVAKTASAC